MSAQHTLWAEPTHVAGREDEGIVLDAQGCVVARTFSRASAEHLSLCVNAHDELVEALRQANEESKLHNQHPGRWGHVIAKATGRQE